MRRPRVIRRFVRVAAMAGLTLGMAGGRIARSQEGGQIGHLQGEMAGEVTADSVILQSRLTAPKVGGDGDVPGMPGAGRFVIAADPGLVDALVTPLLTARPESDFILKAHVTGLEPDTVYHYRLEFGERPDALLQRGPVRTFRTLPGAGRSAPLSLVVVTGMNYARFHGTGEGGRGAYQGADRHLGYPALETIRRLAPDYFIGTGDNVYYDTPTRGRATTPDAMRRKWHEQFVQPRFVELFAGVGTYWEKDDHDHRFNDNDNSGAAEPSSALGIRIFREQVPVVPPGSDDLPTYRTHRFSRELQLWFVEGRDYRSPNASEDGPAKTLWGAEQLAWLQRTLLESDAAFRILVSPTPIVGPDDASKRDNHVNPRGFRHEGDAFLSWLGANGFVDSGFLIVCGDRHWQYHSVHPLGIEEFSCGALVDANSRLGRRPGDPQSTDPDGLVLQPYTQSEPSGGFLHLSVRPASDAQAQPVLAIRFLDENGVELHRLERRSPR